MTRSIAPADTGSGRPVLVLRGLTKRYGTLAAVDGLDLEVLPGEILGLLGPNGSGKSTALNMIMGFIRPTAGTITIDGHDLVDSRRAALASVGGLVEGSGFYPYLTGRRNLETLAAVRGLPETRVDEVLKLVELDRAAARTVGGYSQGMRQRLGVAAALLHRPRLLVLDEPTSGLDPAGTREMRALLPDLASEGTAIVLASHLLTEVQQVCQRVAILQAGRVIASGDVDALLRRDQRWRVRVQPQDAGRAREVIRMRPDTVSVEQEGSNLLIDTRGDGGDLNRALFDVGITAIEIEPVIASLEAVFMELTEGGEIR